MIDDDSPTSGTQWKCIDNLVVELGNKYAGRELVVKIEWEFEDGSDNAEQSKTGSSASANMARALDQELETNKGESCSLFAQINAIWRCDNPQTCSAPGNDKKRSGPCWTDSKHQHYKLISPMLLKWVEAIVRKEPGVDVYKPPQSVLDLLTAVKPEKRQPPPVPASSGVVNHHYYGKRPGTAASDKTPRKDSPGNSLLSPPFRVHEARAIHDSLLREYGLWLQYHCSLEAWREGFCKAVNVCEKAFLRLEHARKKPLEWWHGNGIPEGIARMFCEDVKEWGKWRIAPNGMIRKVEPTGLPEPDDFRILTVDPPGGKSFPSQSSRTGLEAGFDFDAILGDHANESFIEEGIQDELEGLVALREQQMIEAQPLDPFLEGRFSNRLSGRFTCNNSPPK